MSSSEFMFCLYHRAADIKQLFILFSLCFFFSASHLSAVATPGVPPSPAFLTDANPLVQTAPYITLRWEFPEASATDADLRFEIEGSDTAEFAETFFHYEGADTASYISGLAEGNYFFRVRSLDAEGAPSTWSDPLQVTIKYESLAMAFTLFGIGAIVSLATVALIITGDRRTRREEAKV